MSRLLAPYMYVEHEFGICLTSATSAYIASSLAAAPIWPHLSLYRILSPPPSNQRHNLTHLVYAS